MRRLENKCAVWVSCCVFFLYDKWLYICSLLVQFGGFSLIRTDRLISLEIFNTWMWFIFTHFTDTVQMLNFFFVYCSIEIVWKFCTRPSLLFNLIVVFMPILTRIEMHKHKMMWYNVFKQLYYYYIRICLCLLGMNWTISNDYVIWICLWCYTTTIARQQHTAVLIK